MAEKTNNLVLFDSVKKEVAYHNDFSNAVFTNFSRKEKQLLLFLIAGIKSDDIDEKVYHFNPKEVKTQLDFTRQNYKLLANLVDSMGAKPLVIFKPNRELEKIYLFDKVTYKPNDKSIKIIWGKSAMRLFKNLKGNFSKYFLKNILNLQKENSIELYLRAEASFFKGFFDIDIEDMKTIFNVNYTLAGDIKRNVIAPAVKDININTDIDISVENIKEGRVVKGFTFKIQKKNLLTDDLIKIIEKAKKNIWINKSELFNGKDEMEKTVHTLLRSFSMEELKTGLNLCYDSIKKEFKQTAYLEKAIKYALEDRKKLDIKEKKSKQEEIEKKSVPKVKEKNKKVSETEKIFIDFEKIEKKEQEKIEEIALISYMKENNISKSFLKNMKEKSPTMYYNTLKEYIINAMTESEHQKKDIPAPKKRGRRKKLDMIGELNKSQEVEKNEKIIKTFMRKKYGKEKTEKMLENISTYEEIMFDEYICLLKEKESKK